jgi:elongation factor Ts
MAITASQVQSLRERTNASMMACKRALEEAQGDEEKAIELLRKRGEAKAAEKAGRETHEGAIVTEIRGNKAAIVKLTCETDFVAKNEEFRATAKKICDIALAKDAAAAVEAAQPLIKELFGKLGENMNVEVEVVEGEGLGDYVHSNSKIGVVVSLKSPDGEKAKDVAMHVAAMSPKVIHPDEITTEMVDKEKEIWRELLKTEGKPEAMHDKIMVGKEKKFREEHALLKQVFVKDGQKTVEEYLSGNSVVTFKRLSI